jgi:hypothetical protein
LFTDVGSSEDNLTDTTLDDEASMGIASAVAPFTGSYRPEGPLSALDGEDPNGTWYLEITDDAAGDTGILHQWTLRITTAATAAEVTVLGNGLSIAAGDTTPSTSDHTDFGTLVQANPTISRTFTVRNDGTATLTLGAVTVPTGFTLTEGLSGSLAPGASDTFTVRLDNAIVGVKSGTISFSSNDADENPFTFRITGTVTAAVSGPLAEQFTGGPDSFDLAYRAVLFTPAGAGYTFTTSSIGSLPTSPAGGTVVALGDDAYAPVNLGTPVVLFGQSYSTFYIASNGYLTFTQGDTDYSETLAEHFSTPRIALLYDDLNPSAGGRVSWRQLSDRVVVTWENVPEYGSGSGNTFQVEMYFDGRIRLAYLGVAAADGLVGLSNGAGLPGGFVETDFSAGG